MKFRKVSDGYVLVLKKGEPLAESVQNFCTQNQVTAGFITGLGAVLSAEVGYRDLEAKEYRWQKFDKVAEITNLTGTVALVEGEVNLHAHITLAGEDYQAYGGHLKEATIGGTCEIHLSVFDEPLSRKLDDDTGLKLLDL